MYESSPSWVGRGEKKKVAIRANRARQERVKKLHNGVDTNTVIDGDGQFWTGAFAFFTFSLDYDFQENVASEPNMASVRYVETVKTTDGSNLGFPARNAYPFGQTFIQYEHALVTVDDDCKMVLWDQYGDNQEQTDVIDASDALIADPAIQCLFGGNNPAQCAELANEPPETDDDSTSASEHQHHVVLTSFLLVVTTFLVVVS